MDDVLYVGKEPVFKPCVEYVLVCLKNLRRIYSYFDTSTWTSVILPNFNLYGVIRCIVLKSEKILLSTKGKSLILFTISQVSHWIGENRSFNMVFSIDFLTSYILRSTFLCILCPPIGHFPRSIFTLSLCLDLKSRMSSLLTSILWWAGFLHLLRAFWDNQLRKETLRMLEWIQWCYSVP